MWRSERYIPPTAEELARMQRAAEAARQFDQDRQTLLCVALARRKKVDLIELLLRLAEEEKSCSWILERVVNRSPWRLLQFLAPPWMPIADIVPTEPDTLMVGRVE